MSDSSRCSPQEIFNEVNRIWQVVSEEADGDSRDGSGSKVPSLSSDATSENHIGFTRSHSLPALGMG